MIRLTTPQKNIWNLQKYYDNTSISNLCGAIFYNKKLSNDLLIKAINKEVELQEGLRLCFKEENGEAVQYVSEYSFSEFPYVRFENENELELFAGQYAQEPMELYSSKMYQITVFELYDKTGVIVRLSHLISDAWSFSIFAKEVSQHYNALASNEDIRNTTSSYIDYCKTEQKYFSSSRFEKDTVYWQDKYAQKPEPSFIKTASMPISLPTAGRYITTLSPEQTSAIDDYCSKKNLSQAVLFESAIIAYLSRINSENKAITIGIPVLNRSTPKEKSTIGMFISTMPLTVTVSLDDKVTDLCCRITDEHSSVFRHQKYPYSRILNYVREKHDFTGNMYDVMVSFQNAKTQTEAQTKWYSNGFSEVPFTLHIDNRDNVDSYTLTIDYQNELFRQKGEISLLINRILLIIEQIIEKDTITIGELNIIPEAEYELVINKFNDTSNNNKIDKCVHQLFEEQSAKTPDKIALFFEDKQFTYKQLDEMSNSLAHYLREKGVKANDVVPIIAKRSWHIIVAMLGILKAGGAYMPVDPEYPDDRIEYMLETSESTFGLSYGYNSTLKIDVTDLDDFDYTTNTSVVKNVNSADDLCYVIFTSGSTGKPKGVSICHRNVLNYCSNNANNICHKVIRDNCKSIVSVTNIIFDIFVTESILPLLNNITIYFANDEQVMSQRELGNLISNNDIDVIQTTPTKMRSYIIDKEKLDYLSTLKVIILGGEAFPPDLCKELNKYTNAEIFNIYGPAETTVWSTNKKVSEDSINIGKPMSNTQVYVLDTNKKPLPIDVAGELCISGDGVGRGYLNRPELTSEKFIPNPFIEGKTMYCTGDLARWREDGELEYLGRIDTQVKIRGLRIELGEIESVMSSFEGIQLAAVTDKRDENNRQYLVGYYTAESDIDEKALRSHLSAKLPKYMVPNYFVHLTEIPMTASGKTDRKTLPLPDFSAKTEIYIEPVTKTEKALAELYEELLKIDKVGRNDSFFDLGGDSLLAINLLNRISNKFNVEISMKEIFNAPTIDSLAAIVDSSEKNCFEIKNIGDDKYTLLPQQKAIYAVCIKDPETLAYNMPTRISIPNSIDREKIKECFKKLVESHRSLKTHIIADSEDVYGVYDDNAEIVFEEYNNENYNDFIRPFDLTKAPLIRIGFTENAMLFDMHHIIGDGEALNIILRNLTALYNDGDIIPCDREYSDYAEYFYNADFNEHKAYFKNMLKCDFEPVVLPGKNHQGMSRGASKIYSISKNDFENARKFAQKNKLTETMVFFGAYCILLSKFTAKSDILSSIVMTNRIHTEIQHTIGMFVNTLPVAINTSDTIYNYYASIKDIILNLFKYQEIPFYEIAKAVGMTDKSVVNTSFIYQADGIKKLSINDSDLIPEFIDTHTAKFDVSFELIPNESGCIVRIEYDCEKYENRFIDKLFNGYTMILRQLNMENVADISVLDDEEYNKVIYEFNDTAVDYTRETCIHELFCEQARKTPDKIALFFEDKQFTYKQLDEMSNSLAHYLREKGVKANDVVPIIAKRSWHIIVAMLGILKAGGAYMPVDPEYPDDRIEYMLETSESAFGLSYGYNSTLKIDVTNLDDFDYTVNTSAVKNVNSADDLCYVIFTSGSTGKPKGVSICHRNVSNYCSNNANNVCHKVIRDNCKSIVSVTNIIFDIFVTESILPLLNNITIYFANDEQVMSQKELGNLISNNDIDVIQTTPTKMRSYIIDKDKLDYLSTLKVIILGGEAFPPDLCKELNKYTNAEIFNNYGPAETTVWSTNKLINYNEKDDEKMPLHKLIARQAEKDPDKIAVYASDKDLTFSQLDDEANRIANGLIKQNISEANYIAIMLPRKSFVLSSIIAVLKAGCAYMPIAYDYPIERVRFMLTDSKAKAIITTEELIGEFNDICNAISITELLNNNCSSAVNSDVSLDNPFVVLHTSGSTGKPKGVELTHKNILNHFLPNEFTSLLKSCKVGICLANIVFDMAINEMLSALLFESSFVLADENSIGSAELLSRLINTYSVDFIICTPTKFKTYLKNELFKKALVNVKIIVFGGEKLDNELCDKITSCSNAVIINGYGPTETTIVSTYGKIVPIDITIGKPIANTQVYILDSKKKPLPIGVAGELCISGDGVGKGYLNRPELTAEKFIPNPFIEGKTMYCTGDLARWREDGELEYLGRIDTQVKIRGLRIELGEIESVMSSFEGIQLAAVTDKRDENNRQYLVGYYTADSDIDEKALRSHLSAKLPKYMVPNYFVHLTEIPMTASGKTDRKNLPLPDFTVVLSEYIAPETDKEIKLCKVVQELFGIEKIGVTDDFFDIGGDSLKAIEYVAKAHNAGIDFALQNVFDYPTIRELCSFIDNGTKKAVRYKAEDFEKYNELLSRNIIDESFVPHKKALGNVMLTGATGFLGMHVLDNLIQNEAGKIYCLVRNSAERFNELLKYYFGDKYDAELGKRIIPVIGDIVNENLSDDVPNDVQTVIHTAATVKHYGSYEYFRNVNVSGTENVIRYAKSQNAKLIHISTLSVSGNSLTDEFEVYHSDEEKQFFESDLFIGQPLENVYVRSKFEAEMAVFDAMLDGLDAKIIRVGNLTNRESDFKFQQNYRSNAFLTRFKAAVEFGMFPDYLLPLYAEFSPIDKTADGVVKIAQYADRQNVFHLNSNQPIYFDKLLKVFERLGIKMELVSGERFNQVLQQTAKNANTEYIYEAFQNDMDENGKLIYDSNIHIINDFTDWFMRLVGFQWTQTDFDYIKGYVEYFRSIGYLEVYNEK